MRKVLRTVVVGAAASALVAAAGTLTLGGAAWSHNPPGTAHDPKLVKITFGAGEVGYNSARNAPGSPKRNALRFKTDGLSGARVQAENVGLLGDAIGDVTRLSLKARHTGAPRLELRLSTGRFLTFETRGNCGGGVDYGNGWFKYNFSTSPSCEVLAWAARGDTTVYDNYAAAVAEEGAGSTINRIRVYQSGVGRTGWVDDIRLGALMFAGPNVHTHSH